MHIAFLNDGIIDLRAIKTFGASSKVGESPIGHFGTGLKYAIAILLREQHSVVLYRGAKRYTFSVKATKIRNDEFNIVTMNGEELGFTTELGKDWELWQAFRELWCNTMDEGGSVIKGSQAGESGTTTIVVEGLDFAKIYDDRGTITLDDSPDVILKGLEIRRRRSQYLYYRGIRVMKLEHPSELTYNLTRELSLTEDRTIKYSWDAVYQIKTAITKCHEVDIIKTVLTANEDSFEKEFDFLDMSFNPSSTFRYISESMYGSPSSNRSAERLCRELARKEMVSAESTEISTDLKEKLDAALKIITAAGEDIDRDELIIVPALDRDADCLVDDRKVFISVGLLVQDVDTIATRILAKNITFDYAELAGRLIGFAKTKLSLQDGRPTNGN